MKSGIEKLNKITESIYKGEMIMGMLMLCVVSLIACKMPTIMEKEKSENLTHKEDRIMEKRITVIVDPGHGGVDPGKVGVNGALEKDINLAIALRLRDTLIQNGYEVIMTRDTDKGLYDEQDSNKKRTDMRRRCEIINAQYQKDANTLNISIHQNSYGSQEVKGPQVFYYSKSDTGRSLAGIIQNNINNQLEIDKPRREKANDNYYMLVHTNCPSIIVECGFLSNWEEADLLLDEAYQQQLVDCIYKGIEMYYEKYKCIISK